jgi:predicted RNA-binding Zn ribbon-like protein
MSKLTDPFEWSGGHPALDFVNTLDERSFDPPIENLATYRDLVRFTELAGLIRPPTAKLLRGAAGPASTRVARQARQLREQLHRILAAQHSERQASQVDLDAIGKAVLAAHAAREIVVPGSLGIAEHAWKTPAGIDVPLHACSLAIERLLLDVDRHGIRKCEASDCDVYFIDTSKGHRRLWCSMKNCGNREKQRRWRSGEE